MVELVLFVFLHKGAMRLIFDAFEIPDWVGLAICVTYVLYYQFLFIPWSYLHTLKNVSIYPLELPAHFKKRFYLSLGITGTL